MTELLDELRAEQTVLDELLAGRPHADWETPTPAAGWTVRDTIAHLASIDELALACTTGDGRSALAAVRARAGSTDELMDVLAAPGQSMSVPELLGWWRRAREELTAAFAQVGPDRRVHWGPSVMAARSLATARLMECWAHGLDCFAALGVAAVDSPRIRHVCRLGYQALPYAFRVARRHPPAAPDELRLQLVGPSGVRWMFGPATGPHLISGDAGQWARVAVKRLSAVDATGLEASGPLARAALDVARAYV